MKPRERLYTELYSEEMNETSATREVRGSLLLVAFPSPDCFPIYSCYIIHGANFSRTSGNNIMQMRQTKQTNQTLG